MEGIIHVREAVEADLSIVLKIEEQSFDTEKFSLRRFEYLMKKSKGYFLVATIQKSIAGYIILLKRKNCKSLRIYSLATDQEYRGLGVAKKLIEYAEQIAQKENLGFLNLEVSQSNSNAIRLYKKSGFEEKRIVLNYYDQGNHALLLYKKIGKQLNQ